MDVLSEHRWRRRLLPIKSIILFIFCCCPLAAAGSAPLDLRVVIDVSRQMADADPEGVRANAVELLTQTLPDEAYAGVWTYARYVNMLIAHGRADRLWKTQAVLQSQRLPAAGAGANLAAAIGEATWDLSSTRQRQRHMLVISDGALRTAEGRPLGDAAIGSLLEDLLPALLAAGYRVHVLELPWREPGEDSPGVLRELARTTGGVHREVADLGQLEPAMLEVVQVLEPQARLPVAADQGFLVEQGLDEMTVLRLRTRANDELMLIDPTGQRYSRQTANVGFRWQVGDGYDLVTFAQPRGGRWYFSPDTGAEARVLVLGGLEPAIAGLPAMVFPGELKNFRLDLSADGRPLTDPEFLDLLEVRAEIVSPGGSVPVPVTRKPSGYFELSYLAARKQGRYRLRVDLDGPTFQRRMVIPFTIHNPISLRILPGDNGGVIWLALTAGDIAPGTTTVKAMATRPMQGATQLPVESFPGGLWKISLSGAGVLELSLDISGKQLNGNDFSIPLKPVVITLPVLSGKRLDFDLDGLETNTELIADDKPAPIVPVVVSTEPIAEAEEFELPVWFAGILAPLNLLLGLAVFFLVVPPALPEGFLTRVAELEQLVGLDATTGEEPETA